MVRLYKLFQEKYINSGVFLLKQRVTTLIQPEGTHRVLFFYYSKALAIIFFIAFLSLFSQVSGLYFSDGVLPIANMLEYASSQLTWVELPHFFFASSDSALYIYLALAICASICLLLGIIPIISTFLCWAIYLSFVTMGSVFMSFQWDILLLEVAFFSIFAMPTCLVYRRCNMYCPPKIFVIIARLCCFRLVFFSGLVKLLSQDPSWIGLRALDVHYYTQPLPHVISWYAHQLPAFIDKFCVFIMLSIELICPFLLFFNQKLRYGAVFCIVGLMCIIMLTGNYCFFNLLTILLALMCLDDSIFSKKNIDNNQQDNSTKERFNTLRLAVFSFIFCSAFLIETARFVSFPFLSPIISIVQRWHISNNYGLFATMTTQRNELEIWASQDKKQWDPYIFKYKPNNAADKPKFVLPHQPRLDWQFWFVSLRPFNQRLWVMNVVDKLFVKSKHVEGLFEDIPFQVPPKYIVLVLKRYTFTNLSEFQQTGHWWKVDEPIQYSPIFINPYLKN